MIMKRQEKCPRCKKTHEITDIWKDICPYCKLNITKFVLAILSFWVFLILGAVFLLKTNETPAPVWALWGFIISLIVLIYDWNYISKMKKIF